MWCSRWYQVGEETVSGGHGHVTGPGRVADDHLGQQPQGQGMVAVGFAGGLDLGSGALHPLDLKEGHSILRVQSRQFLMPAAGQAVQFVRKKALVNQHSAL